MAVVKYEAGSSSTVMTTELNSLTNGSRAIATNAYDNSTSTALYTYGAFELNVTFGTAPTNQSLIDLYLVPSIDGTNYADASSSVVPSFDYWVGSFQLRNVNTAQKVALVGLGRNLISLPPLKFKPLLINNSGQSFPASGSTVLFVPYRIQVV
jgi:hypothetical protein